MGVTHGKNGKVKLTDDLVAETTKWTLNETVPVSDTTAQGDGAETHLTGIPSWTANVEGHYDPDDTDGQSALTIGASVDIQFYTDGDATGKTYKGGTASVTDISNESSKDDRNSFSVTLKGNGPLTQSTVSA